MTAERAGAPPGPERLLAYAYPTQPGGWGWFKRTDVVDCFGRHPAVELVLDPGELDGRRPDIVLLPGYGHFIADFVRLAKLCRSAVAVEITGEAYSLRSLCDWSFGFGPTDERHMFYHMYPSSAALARPERAAELGLQGLSETPKTRFCHFLYSNPYATERIDFAKRLMRVREVDCLGPVLNNVSGFPPKRDSRETVRALAPYKFGIAFENHSRAGYTSEKIGHCLLAGNVPVYWGDPEVAEVFNPDAFINCHDFSSLDEAAERVLEVDSDPELYARYRAAPALAPGSPLERMAAEVEGRVAEIVDSARRIQRAGERPFNLLRWLAVGLRVRWRCVRHVARLPAWRTLPSMAKYVLWDSVIDAARVRRGADRNRAADAD